MSTALADATDDAEVELELELAPSYSLLARVGAEAFGTFVLVLFGVGTALWAGLSGVAGYGLAVPLAFGIAVLAAASAVGHVSGGHFNPAVTFGAAISRRVAWADLVPYWVAQIVGGLFATTILYVLMPTGFAEASGGTLRAWFSSTSNGFGEHSPIYSTTSDMVQFSLVAALVIELVATAVFVGVILGVTDKRSKVSNPPVVIGLTLTALIALTVPFTNASINPARSTASALFSDFWAISQLWVFWVAPLAGAAIAALIYVLVTRGPAYDAEPAAAAVALAGAGEPEITEVEDDGIDALLARAAATEAAAEAEAEAEAEAAEAIAALGALEVDDPDVETIDVIEIIEIEGDDEAGDAEEADPKA